MRIQSLAMALLVGAGSAASAQVPGLPVVNSGVPLGVEFASDIGFPNRVAGGGTAIGARVNVGVGLLGFSALVSRYDARDFEAVTSPGVSATLRLFGGPLIPFRVMLQAGVARWAYDFVDVTADANPTAVTYTSTHIPISLGLAATIPVPAFAIKPWIAPRIDLLRQDLGGEARNYSKFAISGGIEVSMLNGFTVRAAYDRVFFDQALKPAILSIGIGFAP